ncbi:MAG: gamma-glutamyltransferase [Chitinivibrionales bacterium]|nr:gamma-glutamyltransferase [Chitinivibrionales bacterium]
MSARETKNTKLKYAVSGGGMVSTAFPLATDAGCAMLKAGGNAVDAACAAAWTLGVCEPQASGAGGQTMMLIYDGKKIVAVDGSSRAPSLAHVSAIYKADRALGYRASTVPSTPATLAYVQRIYGTLPGEQIMEPAIAIAENGYKITPLQHRLQSEQIGNFAKIESRSGYDHFLKNGAPWPVGSIFRQDDLAMLLRTLARKGIEEFYTGSIAKQIDADMRENGGLLRYDDLALIPWPIIRKPLRRGFRKYRIYSMPPPGAGRSLLFALMMTDAIPAKLLKDTDRRRLHILAEIFRRTLLERSDRPYDPNFYAQHHEKDMLDREYARECIAGISRAVDKTLLPSLITEDEISGETTHLSVIDKNNMAVSLTQSIERVYGSKAAAAGLGFLYNNYMYDFEYKLPRNPYYLRPNAVPWASVAPSLVFKKEDLWMALGSPGSGRIFSCLAQFLIHVIDEKMSLYDAMVAPRLHCSLGGRISIEKDRFPEGVTEYLLAKGYRIDIREPYAFYLGAVHAAAKSGGEFQGVAEIRRDGTAGGI